MMKKLLAILVLSSLLVLAMPAALAQDAPITVFRSAASSIPDDDMILPLMEKGLGFDLEWVTVIPGEYDTQLNVRLAGGNVPDIFGIRRAALADYVKQDLLLDIGPYLDQMPALQAAYSEKDINRGRYNGVLYTISQRPFMPYAKFCIRTDWLANLGMEAPKTLDDLYDMMYAFTYSDPDGNGKQDTYALTGVGLDAFEIIFSAYGTARPGNFLIKDNQVVYTSVDPLAKDAIMFIQKCIENGLVDPELVSNTVTTARDKAISGQAGIFGGITFWDIMKATFTEQAHTVNPDANWDILLGVVGPAGVRNDILYDESASSAYYAINAELADQPERLAKVLALFNYLCDNDGGQRMAMFGVEGIHYNIVDGQVVATEEMVKLTHTYIFQLTGRDDLPYLKTKFTYLDQQIDTCVAMHKLDCYNAAITEPEGFSVTDLERYANDEFIKFIYGERSLDEWDDYVSAIFGTFGLQDYLDKATEDLMTAGYIQ